MKTWQKLLVIVAGGGIVWGLTYLSSIMPDWAMVIGPFSAGVVALVGKLTGFTPTK